MVCFRRRWRLTSVNFCNDGWRLYNFKIADRWKMRRCSRVWQLLETNQLKVFSSLSMFLEEYRIGEIQLPLLLCAQALASRPDLLTWLEPDEDEDDFGVGWGNPYGGHDAWMR